MLKIFLLKELTKKQKEILGLLIISAISDGISEGLFVLQEAVAIKALSATKFQVSLISLIMFSTLIFSIFFSSYLKNRSKSSVLLISLIFGRLIFVFSPLIKNATIFLVFLFLFYTTYAISFPVLNLYFQKHFPKRRGIVFAYYRATLMLFTIISASIGGKILDKIQNKFYIIFIIAGLFSSLSFLILIIIDRLTIYSEQSIKNFNIKQFFHNMIEVFKEKDFIVFEAIFMTYGLGFMIIQPAIPIYLIKELKFTYSQVATAKGVFAQIFRMFIIPFAGLVFDNVKPWRIGVIAYFTIILFPIMIVLSSIFPYKTLLVYAGFSFFSIALAGLSLMWNLGSIYFSKGKESTVFQGLHVSLTGVRGIIGPVSGYFLIAKLGPITNFIVAGILFFLAGIFSLLYNWEKDLKNNY